MSLPESDVIAARYGRTRTNRTRDRLLLIAAAAFAAIVLVAWVVWAGLDGQKPQIEVTDTGEGLLIDAPPDPDEIGKHIARHDVAIVGILLTHGHVDHTGGAGKLAAGSGALATLGCEAGLVDTEPVTSDEGFTEAVAFGALKGFSTSKRPEFEQPASELARSARAKTRSHVGTAPERRWDAGIWLLTHTHKRWSLNKHCPGK